MTIHEVETSPRFEIFDNKSFGIQSYDRGNDYPQRVRELIAESGTATSCMSVYAKFIRGKGFDSVLAAAMVNSAGVNLNGVLRRVSNDVARFHGLAIHVNYNGFYEVCEISHVPFEMCRLGIPDDRGFVSHIHVAEDWTGCSKGKRLTAKDVRKIAVFNPIKEVVQAQIAAAGSSDKYTGQILWISYADGGFIYPTSLLDPIVTDLSSEAGVATIKNRNVKNNFFPAGIVVFPKSSSENPDDDGDQDGEEDNVINQIKKLQGDRNACRVAVVTKEIGEDDPKFIPFSGDNYDKAFESTEESVQKNIGRMFSQPPILRCEAVNNGFADDIMQQAYNFYNSVTEDERAFVEDAFIRVLAAHTNYIALDEIHIRPLSYGNATTI